MSMNSSPAPPRTAPACSPPLLRAPMSISTAIRPSSTQKCSTSARRTRRKANSARVQAGLGAIPRISGDGQTIYRRKLSLSEAERRINAVHRPYHALLQNLVAETKEQFGCAVLIDCHSMPNNARGAHAPDVVLGDRFGASCHPFGNFARGSDAAPPRLSRRAQHAVRRRPHHAKSYGRPAARVHAMQIEINRALYMSMSARSNAPTATPACAPT
jgi:N-formylglutamate amidohydrolase